MATLAITFNEDGSAEVSIGGAKAVHMTFNQWQNQIRKSALEVAPNLLFPEPLAEDEENFTESGSSPRP